MTRRRRNSEEFKQNAVRMTLNEGKTASEVARKLRIHPSQLVRWRQEMRDTAAPMPRQENVEQEPARRPQDWTAEQKPEAVMASQKLPDAELGTFLRSPSYPSVNAGQEARESSGELVGLIGG